MVSPPSSDPTTWWWILDFVLQEPSVPDAVANALLLTIPLPEPLPASSVPSRIQRQLLLRRLSSSLPLSFATLRALDLLHFHFPSPSPSIAAAYAAVAVHLAASAAAAADGDFAGTVADLFGARVAALERCPAAAGLLSDRLRAAAEEMAAAVADPELRARVVERRDETRREALEAIRVLVAEQREAMGPPFLEVAAQVVMRENRALMRERSPLRNGIANEGREIKLDSVLTPEVDKVTNALKSSCADLQKAVEDPLPDAVVAADEVLNRRSGEMGNEKGDEVTDGLVEDSEIPTVENGVETSQSEDSVSSSEVASALMGLKGGEDKRNEDAVVHDAGKGIEDPCLAGPSTHANATARPSLMDWNPTAHTYEWNDSIDSLSEEKSQSPSNKPHLPSPKSRMVSPLKLAESKKVSKRRKVKKWSLLEEETLRKAVQEHGKGSWKAILNSHHDIFEERTEVDLKDKWRNMTRH